MGVQCRRVYFLPLCTRAAEVLRVTVRTCPSPGNDCLQHCPVHHQTTLWQRYRRTTICETATPHSVVDFRSLAFHLPSEAVGHASMCQASGSGKELIYIEPGRRPSPPSIPGAAAPELTTSPVHRQEATRNAATLLHPSRWTIFYNCTSKVYPEVVDEVAALVVLDLALCWRAGRRRAPPFPVIVQPARQYFFPCRPAAARTRRSRSHSPDHQQTLSATPGGPLPALLPRRVAD